MVAHSGAVWPGTLGYNETAAKAAIGDVWGVEKNLKQGVGLYP